MIRSISVFSLLICAVVVWASSTAAGQPVDWPVTAGGNGHSYEAVAVAQTITWEEANQDAVSRGGHLVTITTQAENDFVFNLIDDDQFWVMSTNWRGPWIGGIQPPGSLEPDGGWMWVSGEPFQYSNWNIGQPNEFNGNNENRIHFGNEPARVPFWNDIPSDFDEINSYVIEYVPEPGSAIIAVIASVVLTIRFRFHIHSSS